jgi:hypothetical protein
MKQVTTGLNSDGHASSHHLKCISLSPIVNEKIVPSHDLGNDS